MYSSDTKDFTFKAGCPSSFDGETYFNPITVVRPAKSTIKQIYVTSIRNGTTTRHCFMIVPIYNNWISKERDLKKYGFVAPLHTTIV